MKRPIELWVIVFITIALSPAFAKSMSTTAPLGYIDMCKYRSYLCTVDWNTTAEAPPHQLDANSFAFLVRVTRWWNSTITPRVDPKERWSGSVSIGDCEEYAIAKRRTLLRNGYSPSQLLLVMVKERPDSLIAHLILVVRTDKGNYVLDNLNGNVLLLEETKYIFVKRQREDRPFEWTLENFSS